MTIGQLGLGYSIKSFLERNTGIKTVLHFDGINLPEEKPFILITQMPNGNSFLSKQRETVITVFRFEVGLFERSLADRTKSQDIIRDLFLFEQIPVYDNDGNLTSKAVEASIRNETPVNSDDITDKTMTHRVYFDIEVQGTKHKNRGN